ncbi:uncharacterized protein CANTADRAFT_46227 [Suhomyces tanzawaensis NRRL Y-17324]|uniref:HDA1 complex subunit 3 n=1 Tax=Suhomyces tanzawaensis NRRL Y-17324 TaxID=984487 RepID=A0A1E4SNH2_9ASCO|nr:uncharacterized protein CANTADRAFT_46227 [Suhomyces tanzawaensis NRRL Y-17324]ODV81070.1 hypothetical protein CANTADRAFT_46227 [Suhomyces tanzawaensis NRRL Y-17324]
MDLLKILDGTPEPPIVELELGNVNTTGDYHLATPMYEFQKELTDQIVSLHYPDILKYCETNDLKELIVKSLEICINNCMLVSTHPYLLIKHYMPKNLLLKDMSSKLADTSGKFNVLKDLMNVIILSGSNRSRSKTIGVVMKNDPRFFDLVEALLLGCNGKKTIKRYVGQNVQRESKKSGKTDVNNKDSKKETKRKTTDALTTIHLLPCDGEIQKDQDVLDSVRFDALIIFDGYVDTTHDFVNKIRSQNRLDPAIFIRLVPMKTIEHCKVYYSDTKDQSDYLYKLISSIVCLREFIGNLPPDIFPIYNQKLTYLASKFFNQVWETSPVIKKSKFIPWPLPDLPNIPKFSASDVERSLLTEVHFHYTPYDSADLPNVESEKPAEKKRTYYEMKRLELDYITNPLKNDYSDLIGIHSKYPHPDTLTTNSSVLTHRLIMTLNSLFIDLELYEQEYLSYLKIDQRPDRIARETDLTKTKGILDDIDHAESRITISNKWYEKKTKEIEVVQEEIKKLDKQVENYVSDNEIIDEEKIKEVKNQLEIWQLQSQIKGYLARIKSKNEEKLYTNREYENSLSSIKESEEQTAIIQEKIKETRQKLDLVEDLEVKENQKFKLERENLIQVIASEKEKYEALKLKVSSSLKFLRDTSHLKKRKGRAFTPSK